MNQIYQTTIPFHVRDLGLYNNEAVEVLYSPPLFSDLNTATTIQLESQHLDMSSKELKKAEEENYRA